ncbi:histone-lysine N-methyltransferase ASHH3 isoform X2 [Nicotiana tabacum]|uniref:Histone-lysine N-methyltransferase ASHH3 isoform X2 n=1 Tax=Nicotiana tabacum TaxID=4097 RepID=A0AC58TJ77_TOBAC|nr:histone-lysine N-methyltransferase ASHH3-like isoform X2 [Nicotiana tomentosiformis]
MVIVNQCYKWSTIEAMPAMKTAVHGGIGHVFSKLTKEIGDPVDFELPDWLNKWQSMPYTFIKRNIYLTKKVKRRVEDDGIFCSCSSTAESSAVCGKDCLCGMLMSSCSSGCKCGSSCLNKLFHQRPVKKMKLVKTEKCGSGIVADEDIKRGEFVIEYVGEVIDDKTCEERLWKMKHSGETNFYLCEINRDMVIDATYKGNKSRYINHSCSPNTEMQKWMNDGETRIGIFAARDIKRGEHLTYDYQFVQFGADQDCHCGAAGCRRKLGIKPNKPKHPASDAALKIVARQVAATSPKLKALLCTNHVYQTGAPLIGCMGYDSDIKIRRPHNCIGQVIRIIRSLDRRSFGIVKQFDAIAKKHLIMFEDGSVEYFDLSKEDWEFCNFLV